MTYKPIRQYGSFPPHFKLRVPETLADTQDHTLLTLKEAVGPKTAALYRNLLLIQHT